MYVRIYYAELYSEPERYTFLAFCMKPRGSVISHCLCSGGGIKWHIAAIKSEYIMH